VKFIAVSMVVVGVGLSACSTQQPAPLKVVTEAPVVAEPAPAPPTGAQLLAAQPAEVRAAFKEHQGNSKWPIYRTAVRVLYPYADGAEPIVDCAPLRTTDLQLQPGETITDVALGDSERWMATPGCLGRSA
jgi:type IV secretion system protein VirB9